jgi:hypothetical protein
LVVFTIFIITQNLLFIISTAEFAAHVGHDVQEGCGCQKGNCFDLHNQGKKGRAKYRTHCYSDLTYFPFRKAGEERVVSQSGAGYMSGKEKLDQEIPLPVCQKLKNG